MFNNSLRSSAIVSRQVWLQKIGARTVNRDAKIYANSGIVGIPTLRCWRYIGYLLAAAIGIVAQTRPAQAQGYTYESVAWAGGNRTLCENVDPYKVAQCYLAVYNITPAVLQPRDYPSCGLASAYSYGDCIWIWYSSPGVVGGTFETFLITVGASPKDAGQPQPMPMPCPTCVGDPVVPSVANKLVTEQDYIAPGPNPLRFVRYYNSTTSSVPAPNFPSSWTHNFAKTISTISSTTVVVVREGGKAFVFTLSGSNWISDADVSDKLVQLTSGSTITGWQYTNASDDSLETYDAYGNLSSIAYREGTTLTLTYASGTGAPTYPAQLLNVTDSFGRKLSFGYSGGLINTMTDPNGGSYSYATSTAYNLLVSVTYPDTQLKTYLYNEASYNSGVNQPLLLTGVKDENNSRFDSTWYDANGLATQTALAGGVLQYSLTNTLDSSGRVQSVSFVDPLGATRGAAFTSSAGRNRLSSVAQPAASGQPAGNETIFFDTNGNVASAADLNGNLQCSAYDLTRNLETGRVEGMAPGSTCPSNVSTYVPATGTVERKILTQWHSVWHLPAKRAQPLKITTWVYNGDNGVLCAPSSAKVGTNPIGVVCSRSEQATTDATGGAGFSATASGSPRTWAYTYNGFGQVLTANGPRTDVTDVTTIAYYNCSTGYQCGQINTITNALGHITTFSTYNAYGQPLTGTDANSVPFTMTYDTRQRLTSSQVGTETTGYTYYPTGLLKLVTLPDSSTILYGYDAAHRLTDITDTLGNHIHHTLDAQGNHTADNIYDPSSVLRRTHTRVFNALSQLYQDINAAGTAAVTTTFGYDAQGNQTSIAAPLSRNTANVFDALNRLKQITDPASGITKPSYDGNDNLASVKDPRNFTTNYTNDGFNAVTKLVSPDSGTTNNTYDSGGNLATAQDARGALGTYSYDALNRLYKIVYTDQTLNFTYDVGTNGKGRLTGESDANHSMSWGYDTHGRVTSKGQTVGTVTKSVGYGFTNGDMTSMTTPSGQSISYVYTNHRITSISINGATLLSNVTYDPFGPVTGWTWGNGTTVTRTYDTDGKISQIKTAGDPVNFGYDDAFRITSITDTLTPANSWTTLGYDLMDRLNSAVKTGTSYGWTYDANGNRLTQTGTGAATFTPSTTSNRLASTSGGLVRTYGYDAAGNTQTYSTLTFTYSQRGRMGSYNDTSTGITNNYIYNAQGQQIDSFTSSGWVFMMYDEAGHLLGSYNNAGIIKENIWLGDIPVGHISNVTGTTTTYYIHSDQLNSPRQMTLPSNNSQVFSWVSDPFGSSPVTGSVTTPLRFPGQRNLFQTATNIIQHNYFRDYDPQTGRYIQSDPIGLDGGVNTYGYAADNPLSNVDPTGQNTAIATPIIVGGIVVGGICASIPSCRDAAANIARTVRNYCRDHATESDEAREQRCQENLDRDLETCASLSKRDGKSAYKICEKQAMLRYGNCLSGRDSGIKAPLPPWGTK